MTTEQVIRLAVTEDAMYRARLLKSIVRYGIIIDKIAPLVKGQKYDIDWLVGLSIDSLKRWKENYKAKARRMRACKKAA
jgi:hypothetical protein